MNPILQLFISRFTVKTLPQAVRVIRIVIGFSLLLIGLALAVLPGPAIVVIPLGLALLAGEFVWAQRLLKKFNATFKQVRRMRK